MFTHIFLLLLSIILSATSLSVPSTKIIVSGAAGRTGSLVVKKLLENQFTPIGIIRKVSSSSNKLLKQLKLNKDQLIACDITSPELLEKVIKESGAEKYVMCTSAGI